MRFSVNRNKPEGYWTMNAACGSPEHAPDGGGDGIGGEPEMLEQHAARRRLTESIQADDRPARIVGGADVLAPAVGRARFDCYARNPGRQHARAIRGVLRVEHARARHRYDTNADAFGGERVARRWRLQNRRAHSRRVGFAASTRRRASGTERSDA